MNVPNNSLPPPPPAARRWVTALLALAVSVPISLAPLLGNLDVPGFKTLLSLFPVALQNVALAIASAAMALVAVSVQFFADDKFNDSRMRSRFVKLAVALSLLLLALAYVHNMHVVTIGTGPEGRPVSFVVGSTRTPTCGCDASYGDAFCIEHIGLDQARLPQCWAESDIRQASFLLLVLYVLMMSGMGALVGLLVLRSRRSRR